MADRGGRSCFAHQMAALAKLTNVVPLSAALDDLAHGRRLPPRAVALTFDDGYRDNLTFAVPVLRRLGLPATMFLVPGFLSHRVDAWWERLSWAMGAAGATTLEFDGVRFDLSAPRERARAVESVEALVKRSDATGRHAALDRVVDALQPRGDYRIGELFMDWDEARQLTHAGMTIGSHTLSHAILAREDGQDQRDDLEQSRMLLQRELGEAVRELAYPNGQPGDYDATTVDAARTAGYSYAVTTWGELTEADTPPYEIRRWMVSPDRSALRLAANSVRVLRRRGEGPAAESAARDS